MRHTLTLDRTIDALFVAVFICLAAWAVIERMSRHEHPAVDLSYRPTGGRSYGVEIKRLEKRVNELEKEVRE